MAENGGKTPPLPRQPRHSKVPQVGSDVELAGRYWVGDVVGRGGMAIVYRGHDALLDRDVAIKVFGGIAAAGSNREFLHEARAAAALSHQNIVGVFDAGVHGSERFIVMEYVPGGSLFDEIQSEAPLLPQRAVSIAAQLSDALDYGHRHGIVHCDVKPQNVLLDENRRPKLVDFGISSSITSTGALTDTITGTAGYIAPEQLLGERVDGRTDIYSLGCVVYEMLSGELPFEAANLAALATQRLVHRPIPLDSRNPSLPAPLVDAVMRALERDPENRYATAPDFAAALERSLSDTSRRATPRRLPARMNTMQEPLNTTIVDHPFQRRGQAASQNRLFWPLTLLFLLILVLVGALAALGLPSLLSPSSAAAVTVPSVTNQNVDQAAQTLHSLGLNIQPKLEDSTKFCNAKVLSQAPAPPAQVHKGGTVTLVISVNNSC